MLICNHWLSLNKRDFLYLLIGANCYFYIVMIFTINYYKFDNVLLMLSIDRIDLRKKTVNGKKHEHEVTIYLQKEECDRKRYCLHTMILIDWSIEQEWRMIILVESKNVDTRLCQ